MSHIELDSFLFKFKCLWQAGYKASLKVETIAGEAKVVIEAGLGHFLFPHLHSTFLKVIFIPVEITMVQHRNVEDKGEKLLEELLLLKNNRM